MGIAHENVRRKMEIIAIAGHAAEEGVVRSGCGCLRALDRDQFGGGILGADGDRVFCGFGRQPAQCAKDRFVNAGRPVAK